MALMSADDQTIFALSTGGLPSAIAIVRISGSRSGEALKRLIGRISEPRKASLALIRDPGTGEPIDRALVIWFPGPDTATGEDIAEFHIHGSRAVAAKLLETLGTLDGLRPAEAGEFTRRAFLNGRMDLSEAEGLGDLLAAETETQRRHALAMAEGGLARRIEEWRERLLAAEARLEAVLNFSDEGDVAEGDEQFAVDTGYDVHNEISEALKAPPAERLKDGIRVVLAGPPNSGKSTLFNALIAREAAIVSEIAGTTRDVIEAPVEIDGIAFLLSDTAGLRESDDVIEDEGIKRARRVSEDADILLWLGEPDEAPSSSKTVILRSKADLPDNGPGKGALGLPISAKTGEGMAALREELTDRARAQLPREDELALNLRQREALKQSAEILASANSGDWILLVETLRSARSSLDRLSGGGGVEEMLDALFGRFCIGK